MSSTVFHPPSWVATDNLNVGHGSAADDGMKCIWIAVLAQQSLFTPAVLNKYTRGKGGLEHDQLDEVVSASKDIGGRRTQGIG